jgi:hypothetical protein
MFSVVRYSAARPVRERFFMTLFSSVGIVNRTESGALFLDS